MQVDAADDMWAGGRAAGSKMLLEDVDADDDLLQGLGAAAGVAVGGGGGVVGTAGGGSGNGAADMLPGEDANGAAAMDASS